MTSSFDYANSAELYTSQAASRARNARYQRFSSAAEAIRYAIEVLPRLQLRHTSIETGEERIEGNGILTLYLAADYPLQRLAQG